jgi:hypothetical protein
MENITTQTIKKYNSKELADIFIQFYTVFEAVYELPRFRTAKDHVSRFMSVMEQLVSVIITECEENAEESKLLHGVKCNSQQLQRQFLQGGGTFPTDASLQLCVYCQHPTVDEPPENKNVATVNQEKVEKHRVLVAQWDNYKNGNGSCPKTTTGKDFKRHPPPAKLDSLLLQCHCHQMTCSRKGSDVGSTCAIACKKDDGNRFDWKDNFCDCPVCKCNCKKVYQREKIPLIGIVLMAKKNEEDGGISRELRQQLDMQLGKSYLAECMIEGVQVASAAMQTLNNMNDKGCNCCIILFYYYYPLYTYTIHFISTNRYGNNQ